MYLPDPNHFDKSNFDAKSSAHLSKDKLNSCVIHISVLKTGCKELSREQIPCGELLAFGVIFQREK